MALFYTKFKGTRFDDHALPIDMMSDVEAYATMLKKHALYIYKNTSGKSKVPKGFAETLSLKITSLTEGSTKLAVARAHDETAFLMPDSDFLKRSMEEINIIIQSALTSKVKLNIPYHLRNEFSNLGKNLREGESIEWDEKDEFKTPIVYNLNVRKIILANLTNPYQKVCEARGVIDKPSVFDQNVIVRLNNSKIRLQVTYPKYLMDKIRDIHRETERYSVKFIGNGKFNAQDKLESMVAQHIVPYLDGKIDMYPSITDSFEEIAQLKSGWFDDGEGDTFDSSKLSYSQQFITNLVLGLEIPSPYIYPHPNSQVSFEWTIGSHEIAITIDFKKNIMILSAYSVETKKSIREKFDTDFSKPLDRKLIKEFLGNYFPGLSDE